MLIIAILFAFIGAAFSYFVYNQNYNLTPIAFNNFLNNPLSFFSQINNKGNLKINNNNFYLFIEQNNDQKNLATKDYFSNHLSTLNFNTENDESEFNQFTLNNLKTEENIKKTLNTIKLFEFQKNSNDPLIEPKHLLTLQTTKQKICLFEIATSEIEQSR